MKKRIFYKMCPIVLVLISIVLILNTYFSNGITMRMGSEGIIKLVIAAIVAAVAVNILLKKLWTKIGNKILRTVARTIVFILFLPIVFFPSLFIGSKLYAQGVGVSMLDYSMDISEYNDEWSHNALHKCYVLKRVVYVEKPMDEIYQSMTIIVPEEYMNSDGTLNTDSVINGYSSLTAPIIYENGVAGYSEYISVVNLMAADEYLKKGYVYVSVGSRGKQTQSDDGTYIGKAPAGIIDLKAGVRFLKYNDENLAGDCSRIVSVGWSAGGAMSSLLGITGNASDYDSYLSETGAIMTESDDVYASMIYCPIIDLENSDMAYEWMFEADNKEADDFDKAVSGILSDKYVTYVNDMGLVNPDNGEALTLDMDDKSGSLIDYLEEKLEASAGKYLSSINDAAGYASKWDWLEYEDGEAKISSLKDILSSGYISRIKSTLAFDPYDLSQQENVEFGKSDTNLCHFDRSIAGVLDELKEDFPDEYNKYYKEYAALEKDEENKKQVYLLNPFNYIADEAADKAEFFRIRVGTNDADTSWLVSTILSLTLENQTDRDVDFELVWDQPHSAADYSGEFTDWIDSICKLR